MVVTAPLTNTEPETLTQVFNEAFSKYEVPIHMSQEQFNAHTHALGYSALDSIGLFDDSRLVGFVLVARREGTAYDAGTGIIPSYQGKGYSHLLIDATLSHVKKRTVTSFFLEVIDTNERAKNLYLSHGFSITRKLHCYQVKKDLLIGSSSVELIPQDSVEIPLDECTPSWQNSKQSIERGSATCYTIMYNAIKRGSLCLNPDKGSIAQIYIEPQFRRQGFAKQAIIKARDLCEAPSLGMINVDERCTSLHGLLTSLGFSLLLTQSEMVHTL
ncbi:MAG: GNAT family N-acetyltransferase [Sphaerochaeta sp.]